jgi:hypothetical protein
MLGGVATDISPPACSSARLLVIALIVLFAVWFSRLGKWAPRRIARRGATQLVEDVLRDEPGRAHSYRTENPRA